MRELLEQPLWSFLGVLIGALGVAAALFFYLRGRRIAKLSYSVRRFTIFGENVGTLQGLSISCGGKPVSQLFDYRVLMWNSGSEVIQPSDFASAGPPVIHLGNQCTAVVGVNCLATSSPSNRVTAMMQPNETIKIDFEYLAPREGAVLSILSDSQLVSWPRLVGVIKGGAVVPFVEYLRLRRLLWEIIIYSGVISVGAAATGELSARTTPLVGAIVGTATIAALVALVARMVGAVKGPNCDPKLRDTFSRGVHEWEL